MGFNPGTGFMMYRILLLAALGLGMIPASLAAPVPRERRLPDPMRWAYMGVRVEQNSMRVSSTDEGTPARKAGVLPNDLILKVGELTPRSFDDVAVYVFGLRPGSMLILEVQRGSEILKLPMILGERPSEAPLPESILRRVYNRSVFPLDY
jgi:S1-C subfamily serine protease